MRRRPSIFIEVVALSMICVGILGVLLMSCTAHATTNVSMATCRSQGSELAFGFKLREYGGPTAAVVGAILDTRPVKYWVPLVVVGYQYQGSSTSDVIYSEWVSKCGIGATHPEL